MSHDGMEQPTRQSAANGHSRSSEPATSAFEGGEATIEVAGTVETARDAKTDVNNSLANGIASLKPAENGEHQLNGSQDAHGQLDEAAGKTDSDDELEALALSSAITELGYAVQTVQTLLFEVQELRHASRGATLASTDDTSTDTPASEVDIALARLDSQLDTTSGEAAQLQERIEAASNYWGDDFLQAKWSETIAQWRSAQEEAEEMRRELIEDKYLIVYRTVSKQAEDMMQSLEKIFAQCHTFVHEMHSKYGAAATNAPSGSTHADDEALQTNLNTFISLHRSLHQKSKYYAPSCEHVLKTIESGIAQQRSLNGEVLRGHANMKLRWRNLQERMVRTEREMQSVQDLLSDKSEQAQKKDGKAQRSDSTASSSVTSGSRKSSFSTPSKTTMTRTKSGSLLTPSPQGNEQGSSSQSRAVSPFRKIANKLRSSGRGQEDAPPPVPDMPSRMGRRLSSMPLSSQSSVSSEMQQTTPPSNPAILRSQQIASATGQHRHTQSAGFNTLGAPSTLHKPAYAASSVASDRARSPLLGGRPSLGATIPQARPAWNGSTKPIRDDLPSTMARGTPRKSLPYDTPTRSTTPAVGNRSGRITPAFPSTYSRPASRNFTAPNASQLNRAASPAFSATSNTSASAFKARPTSPSSKIPAPAPLTAATPTLKGSPQKSRPSLAGTTRKASSSAPPPDENALETLFFRSATPTDDQNTSLMQRALSPTPSAGGYTVASSVGGTRRRQSHIPVLSVSASSTQNTPFGSPVAAGRQESVFTPEPMLRSRAARASAIYGGVSGRKSLGLPLPASDYLTGGRRQPKTSNASSASDASRRPLSPRQSYVSTPSGSRRISMYSNSPAFTPSVMGESIGAYTPNPVDLLDVELAEIVNSQPCFVRCERVDLPLTKAAAEAQTPGERMARYIFGWSDKPVSCKLVERGTGKGRKVLVRASGVWQDLSIHLLNQQALY